MSYLWGLTMFAWFVLAVKAWEKDNNNTQQGDKK